jgi:ribonuclease VapC
MIAVDSSALVALALNEDDAEAFGAAMSDQRCYIGAPTLLETYIVLHHRIDQMFSATFVGSLLQIPKIEVIGFDLRLLEIASRAFDRYGKGQTRRGLNFGDCLAYAVAKAHDVPLLFKGDDFRHTDIRPALP